MRGPSNPLATLGSIAETVGGSLSLLQRLVTSVTHTGAANSIEHLISEAFFSADKGVQFILKHPGDIWKWYGEATSEAGAPFVESFFHGGLGVDPDYEGGKLKGIERKPPKDWQVKPDAFEVDAKRGINELQRMIGFILSTNLVFAGVGTVAKAILSERHHERVDSMLGTIGEQLGLSWTSGMALSQVFEVAAMDQIRELVNVQVQGARLDMQTFRMLARQHRITPDQAWAGLDLLGYPDQLKSLIMQIDTQQLMPADLQTLWGLGRMTRDDVRTYMEHVGYSDADVKHLMTVWIDHSETQELGQFRAQLRADYLEGRVSKFQYRDMLAQLLTVPHTAPHLPHEGDVHYDNAADQIKMVIDLAVASADFARDYGRTQASIAESAKLMRTKHITPEEFRQRAQQQGYTHQSAAELAAYYQLPPLAGKPAVTTAKVLSYTKSGAITNQQAYQRLIELGVSPKEAAFLAYNPDPKVGPWYAPFNVATVKQAWMDEVADDDAARESLGRLGLNADAIAEELQLWHHQRTHSLLITPAQIRAETGWETHYHDSIKHLYLSGGLGDAETISLLEESGLSQGDAGYLWAGWYTQKTGRLPGPPGVPQG